ncbi:hypothetical protein CF319_g7238 [Tilletia indica]|nr:hypothetical protein CF319_g7238 [Tilletia indica]
MVKLDHMCNPPPNGSGFPVEAQPNSTPEGINHPGPSNSTAGQGSQSRDLSSESFYSGIHALLSSSTPDSSSASAPSDGDTSGASTAPTGRQSPPSHLQVPLRRHWDWLLTRKAAKSLIADTVSLVLQPPPLPPQPTRRARNVLLRSTTTKSIPGRFSPGSQTCETSRKHVHGKLDPNPESTLVCDP